jgi:hypothetical protein
MQKDILLVTDVEAAQALRGVHFLRMFLEPASPSDVAKSAKVPANLVHHHANRCLELGLLFEVKRENRKVFYQLTARDFKIPRRLLEPEDKVGLTIRNLSSAFVKAYEKSDRLTGDDYDFDWCGFSNTEPPQEGKPKPDVGSGEARPAHFQALTVQLSPASYQELVRKMAQLLIETQPEPKDAIPCTFGLMAFEGMTEDELGRYETNVFTINSFVPGIEIWPDSST